METRETLSLGPSQCFAHLFLSFALCLANLYDMPLAKHEGDSKGLQAMFVFLQQFLSLSRLSRSIHYLSLSSPHFIGPSILTVSTRDVRLKHSQNLTSLSIVFIILTVCTCNIPNHNRLEWLFNRILSFSQSVHTMYQTMTDYRQCEARSGSPQLTTRQMLQVLWGNPDCDYIC